MLFVATLSKLVFDFVLCITIFTFISHCTRGHFVSDTVNDSPNALFVVVAVLQESWEDEEEKKDEEKPTQKTDAPAKTKPNKALKAKLAEQEVGLNKQSNK